MQILPITDEEFARFQGLILSKAGISLSPQKKVMLSGRLQRRLMHFGLQTFGEYFDLLHSHDHPHEMQEMVDALTTNETYFFREPAHFDYFTNQVVPSLKSDIIRVWSAACSSGEEAYTLAMLLSDKWQHKNWQVVGSDVSTKVLRMAQQGIYPFSRGEQISPYYLSKYCLKGRGSYKGHFLIEKRIRQRVQFKQVNLLKPLPNMGQFDVIFLRNVLIYFNQETKKDVLQRLMGVLKKGGYLFVSHTESLHGIAPQLKLIKPSVFQKQPCEVNVA
ncbi:MAG: protein-glutamate O-methyltransferase CheR [Candidatus Thiodiazotropha sp.]